MSKLGCIQAKTFVVQFPSFLQDEWLKRAFIRGVFDGDGSIGLYRHYTGSPKYVFSITGNYSFLLDIQQTLIQFCNVKKNKISLNNREGRSNQIGSLVYTGGEQCKRIRDWLYKDATIFYHEKWILFLKLELMNGIHFKTKIYVGKNILLFIVVIAIKRLLIVNSIKKIIKFIVIIVLIKFMVKKKEREYILTIFKCLKIME